jgi:hypothetical protein
MSVPLPPGKVVRPENASDRRPVYWLSGEPATAAFWTALRREHPRSGLWPVLLGANNLFPAEPWDSGTIHPSNGPDPGAYDPATLLARWWDIHAADDDPDDMLDSQARQAITAQRLLNGSCWDPEEIRDDLRDYVR